MQKYRSSWHIHAVRESDSGCATTALCCGTTDWPGACSHEGSCGADRAAEVPAGSYAKKYFRVRLGNCQYGGTLSVADDAADRRRGHLVCVSSHVLQSAGRGRGVRRDTARIDGALDIDAAVPVDGSSGEIAYIECVKSTADRRGGSGLSEKRRNTESFAS